MVKRTITITTILLVLTIAVGLVVALNRVSFAADDDFQETGTHGTCSWKLEEGVLTIYPTNGVSGTLANTEGEYLQPWYNWNKDVITKIIVSDGVELPESCCGLFYGFSKCTEIDVSGLKTENAVNIRNMFYGCNNLEILDVSNLETSHVKKVSGLFAYCSKLPSIDLSSWDMSNVDDVCIAGIQKEPYLWGGNDSNGMFHYCSNATSIILPDSFDASKVTSLNHLFGNCSKLSNINVSNWNTSKVRDMRGLFYGCTSLKNLSVINFNTSNVTDMSYMFYKCSGLSSIDLSGFNTENVTDMAQMFSLCSELTSLNLNSFNTSKVTDFSYMLDRCSKLESLDVSNFETDNVTRFDAMFRSCISLKVLDISNFNTRNAISLSDMFVNCSKLREVDLGNEFSFKGKNANINSNAAILPTPGSRYTGKWIREDEEYGPYTPSTLTSEYDGNTMSGKWIAESDLNPYAILDDDGTFYFIRVKDVIENNTICEVQSVSENTYTGRIFIVNEESDNYTNNRSWDSIIETVKSVIVVDTIKPKSMARWFLGFSNCESFDLSKMDTSEVVSMRELFKYSDKVKSLDLSTFQTPKLTSMYEMFYGTNLESLDISSWDTRNVSTQQFMFFSVNNLKRLKLGENFRFIGNNQRLCTPGEPSIYTGKWIREDEEYGPYTASELIDNYAPEMAGTWIWEVKELPYAVFDSETQLLSFVVAKEVHNNNSFGTANSISGGLYTGTIFKVSLTNVQNNRTWDSIDTQVKKVTFVDEIKPLNTSYWFNSFYACTEMDLLKLNMSEVTNMNSMFNNCGKLKSLDVSSFDTSNVTSMDHTFNGCSSLTTMDVSNFDVSNVTTLSCLFNDCGKLKSVNVNGWDVSNVKAFNHMFNASSLETLDLSSFDTSNATYMEWMLAGATSLKSIVLGNNFVFKGKNISNISSQAILPTPSEIGYSGEWVREDKEVGPYTPAELRDNYDGTNMAGKWVWAKAKYNVVYKYDGNIPNGASALPNNEEYEYETRVTIAKDASAPGYTFSGWSRTGTFEMPAEDVTITGSFIPNTDTPYIVEHYLEDITEGSYTLTKTDNLTGTTDTEAEATAKEYEGFTFDNTIEGTKTSGTIAGDGSLVLKLYYKRNSYNVTYAYTGDVPDDASKLPQSETYKYGEEIKVPEDATAEGYTFSGWIKDYINMPAQDIEITGYFIEEPRLYKIEYYFDNELDEALVEILNAEKDEEINLTPQTPVKHGEKNYTLVSNNHNITISVNDNDNVIRVYYETDVLDYAIDNFEDTTEGDGIPDKYQIRITYKVENGNWNDGTKGTKADIITLKDKDGNLSEEGTGTTNIPEVGSKPSEEYEVGTWNEEVPKEVSNKDDGKEFIYSYKKSEKQNIEQREEKDITEASGKIYNPKTDDIVNKYLLVGIGGILVLSLVNKIRRKYSRKAKKIQF